MSQVLMTVVREPVTSARDGMDAYTLGKLYLDNVYFCNTLEDEDRRLEEGGRKEYGRTAIPRGRYEVVLSYSHRFRKVLPEILDVPGFSGVRIHGGNAADDTLGCILIGQIRTANGIAQCAATVQRLISLLQRAEDDGKPVVLAIT